MKYRSTRDISKNPVYVTSAEAIKQGLAPDGGLYIPESFPSLTHGDFEKLCKIFVKALFTKRFKIH